MGAKSPNQKGNSKFCEKFAYKGSSSVKIVEENLSDVEKKISSCNACKKSLKQKERFKFHEEMAHEGIHKWESQVSGRVQAITCIFFLKKEKNTLNINLH